MERVKKPVCTLLFLCSAVMACTRENPKAVTLGENLPQDPVELLRISETATGFDRALVQERLGLTKEAIRSYDEVYSENADRAAEARQRRDALQARPEPMDRWQQIDQVEDAVRRRDRATLMKIADASLSDAERRFEDSDLRDVEGARVFAEILAERGEHYALAIVEAIDRPRDRQALERGLAAFKDRKYENASALLQRAGNPLYLAAQYQIAARSFNGEDVLLLLDTIIRQAKPQYRDLLLRAHLYRANLLEWEDDYLEAHAAYAKALDLAKGDSAAEASILSRRSANYAIMGDKERAFREAHHAIRLSGHVVDLNTRHHMYLSAARAARLLSHPVVALHYQNAAVELSQKAVARAPGEDLAGAKVYLAVALHGRADIHVELGRDADAEADLKEASDLADAAAPRLRPLLQMRVHEVRGQALSKSNPREAIKEFDEAIRLAEGQYSTYRAALYFKRAAVRRTDDDIATALEILRSEARKLVDPRNRGAYEELWTPYFSRFKEIRHQMIQGRIDAGDVEGAFLDAELARALEPMQLLLRSQSVPPGFRPIETKAELQRQLREIPEDTVILQYLVLPDRTYTWVLTRGDIVLVPQRVTESTVKGWVDKSLKAVSSGQNGPFTSAMRDAYGELFRAPLRRAPSKTRIVIVPDEPMYGLAFAGLQGIKEEGYLLERGSIATAASTSLYLYALARDRQFSGQRDPAVLLVGDPALDPRHGLASLAGAKAEVEELARDYYPSAQVLIGAEATVPRFLAGVRSAGIIHFAGHGVANPQSPWRSRLMLARQGNDSGELTGERLMRELSELERARLVVFGACSSAGGHPVGPESLTALVRPLIAAKVPAVVGTLWEVKDDTTRQLLVSLHCHYRHGDDVAVALRNAQLEKLRNQEPARKWAPFQVVGYAASPYARPLALEEPSSEHVCTQNSLQRPDGLHPQ